MINRWQTNAVMLLGYMRRLSWVDLVLALAIIAAAVQAARLIWAAVTPMAPLGDWRPVRAQSVPLVERPSLFGNFDPFFRAQTAATTTETVTALPLTLYGIRTNEASGGGSAIIAGADGVQMSWSVGETIVPGATLHAVAFDHVVINNNGVLETLYIDQSVPAENVTPGTAPAASTAGPQGAAATQINAQSLQQSIGFTPRTEGGKVTGLVVSAKDDGAMLSATGLQKGDIVTSINGRPVSSASEIGAQMRPGARLTIEVERGAQKIPVAIILEP